MGNVLDADKEARVMQVYDALMARARQGRPTYEDRNQDGSLKYDPNTKDGRARLQADLQNYNQNPLVKAYSEAQRAAASDFNINVDQLDLSNPAHRATLEDKLGYMRARFAKGVTDGAPDEKAVANQQGAFDDFLGGEFMSGLKKLFMSIPIIGDFIAALGKSLKSLFSSEKIGPVTAYRRVKMERAVAGGAGNIGIDAGLLNPYVYKALEDPNFDPNSLAGGATVGGGTAPGGTTPTVQPASLDQVKTFVEANEGKIFTLNDSKLDPAMKKALEENILKPFEADLKADKKFTMAVENDRLVVYIGSEEAGSPKEFKPEKASQLIGNTWFDLPSDLVAKGTALAYTGDNQIDAENLRDDYAAATAMPQVLRDLAKQLNGMTGIIPQAGPADPRYRDAINASGMTDIMKANKDKKFLLSGEGDNIVLYVGTQTLNNNARKFTAEKAYKLIDGKFIEAKTPLLRDGKAVDIALNADITQGGTYWRVNMKALNADAKDAEMKPATAADIKALGADNQKRLFTLNDMGPAARQWLEGKDADKKLKDKLFLIVPKDDGSSVIYIGSATTSDKFKVDAVLKTDGENNLEAVANHKTNMIGKELEFEDNSKKKLKGSEYDRLTQDARMLVALLGGDRDRSADRDNTYSLDTYVKVLGMFPYSEKPDPDKDKKITKPSNIPDLRPDAVRSV